ncbi:lactonase family protein [bacterium]|nr:lactonase family protein [bacterium]RQV92040.1 MAG: lactonase family protein [bacterium]
MKRRQFFKVSGVGSITSVLSGHFSMTFLGCSQSEDATFYVGTYTRGESEGIYRCTMNPVSGAIQLKDVTRGVDNPSFLAVDQNQRYLYAVNETSRFEGNPSGALSAFRIDRRTGSLELINQQPSHGTDPCHLIVDQSNRFALVANYSSGSASVFPIGQNGELGDSTDVVQHQGKSIHPRRQQGPHAHCITLDASNRFAFVADLGLDKIMIYRFNDTSGKLIPHVEPWCPIKAGAGPRHFAFHPDGETAYVINELDSTLTVFAYDATNGMLKEMQTLSTLPEGFTGENSCAEVQVAPSGRFVYGSNRGHDSIVVFAVDPNTGYLSFVQHQSTLGRTPRHFTIDPTGRFLLAANQDSDTIVVFGVDSESGILTPTGFQIEVPVPVCLQFVT